MRTKITLSNGADLNIYNHYNESTLHDNLIELKKVMTHEKLQAPIYHLRLKMTYVLMRKELALRNGHALLAASFNDMINETRAKLLLSLTEAARGKRKIDKCLQKDLYDFLISLPGWLNQFGIRVNQEIIKSKKSNRTISVQNKAFRIHLTGDYEFTATLDELSNALIQ